MGNYGIYEGKVATKPIGNHPWEYVLFIESQRPKEKILQLRSSTSIGFPSSDFVLSSVSATTIKILELHFLGLCGISSPLPSYLAGMTQQEAGQAWKDFLNAIENIIYRTSFEGWLKYHPLFSSQHYFQYLHAMSGYRIQQDFEYQWIDAFHKKVPTSKDLFHILKEFLHCDFLMLQDRIPIWRKIAFARIDGQSQLGANAVLGDYYLQADQKIKIECSCDLFLVKMLLPSKELALALCSFLKRYLIAFFFCEFEIHFFPDSAEDFFLGKVPISLDGTMQLGRVKDKSILVLFFESCTQSSLRGSISLARSVLS